MSSFFICMIDCRTLADPAGSGPVSILGRMLGTTCHDIPYPIFQPAALHLFPSLGEALPHPVDLALRFAVHDEGDGFRELELGTAVQREELLPVEPEPHRQDAPLRPRHAFSVASDLAELRILEDGGIEPRRL